jgi:hypothetical protein
VGNSVGEIVGRAVLGKAEGAVVIRFTTHRSAKLSFVTVTLISDTEFDITVFGKLLINCRVKSARVIS